jgi:hypothetical protein
VCVLHLPAVGEVIELSDKQTGFRGNRPNRPCLCYSRGEASIRVVPLSREGELEGSGYELSPSAAYGLDSPSFIVDHIATVDYFTATTAKSLGHLDAEELPGTLDHIWTVIDP